MNHLNPTSISPEIIKENLRSFAARAESTTQSRIVTPAFVTARRAGAITSEAIDKTKDQLAQQVDHAEQFASQQLDRAAKWVSANPFPALGLGFAAGMFLTQVFGRSARH
jgi:uncharacterized membrane protein YqjE/ElaB/YqjD/DUF883 family membrane-anchored ribosome-binding protein